MFDQVYTARRVDTSTLGVGGPRLPILPSDRAGGEAAGGALGTVAPKFAQLTADVVFADLWRRPDLSVRDRSLVTIATLAAMGDDDQLAPYVERAIASGLTAAEITEALTHLAFYAGWPRAKRAIAAVTHILTR